MSPVSRGFGARRRETNDRLPPGQYLTTDFPVLSAGPTPRIDTGAWSFTIRDGRGGSRAWTANSSTIASAPTAAWITETTVE